MCQNTYKNETLLANPVCRQRSSSPLCCPQNKGMPTVDRRNPKQPPGMYKTRRKQWEKLPTSPGDRRISDISAINSMNQSIHNFESFSAGGSCLLETTRGPLPPFETLGKAICCEVKRKRAPCSSQP